MMIMMNPGSGEKTGRRFLLYSPRAKVTSLFYHTSGTLVSKALPIFEFPHQPQQSTTPTNLALLRFVAFIGYLHLPNNTCRISSSLRWHFFTFLDRRSQSRRQTNIVAFTQSWQTLMMSTMISSPLREVLPLMKKMMRQ